MSLPEQVVVTSSYITDIADAIRGKTGESDLLELDDMPDAIEGISGGGGWPAFETSAAQKTDYPHGVAVAAMNINSFTFSTEAAKQGGAS